MHQTITSAWFEQVRLPSTPAALGSRIQAHFRAKILWYWRYDKRDYLTLFQNYIAGWFWLWVLFDEDEDFAMRAQYCNFAMMERALQAWYSHDKAGAAHEEEGQIFLFVAVCSLVPLKLNARLPFLLLQRFLASSDRANLDCIKFQHALLYVYPEKWTTRLKTRRKTELQSNAPIHVRCPVKSTAPFLSR